jgi:hypothetical protein
MEPVFGRRANRQTQMKIATTRTTGSGFQLPVIAAPNIANHSDNIHEMKATAAANNQ